MITNKPLWDYNKSISDNIFDILSFVLVASVFFTNLIHLKHLGSKFQLTELIFLLIIPFIPYKGVIEYQLKHNRTFILIVLIYLFFDLLSSVLSQRSSALLESVGRFYLLGLFAILSYQFSTYDKKNLIDKLSSVLLVCTAAIVLISIYGYIDVFIRGWSRYIYVANNYPYFGTMYRLVGPTIYPTMLISSLTFIILFFTGTYKNTANKRKFCVALVLLCICTLLTLSKSLVLLAMAVLIFSLKRQRWLNKISLIVTTIIFTCIMAFFTHFIVVKKISSQAQSLKSTIFTSNRVIYQDSSYVIFEANYLAVKRAAISMVDKHPFFGIGTGNFNNALRLYKAKGLFPKKLPNFDPHSTYLGILVENGVFAAIMLIAILGFIFKQFIRRDDLLTNDFMLALFMIYLTFLIEGIATDIFNFRHLWLFFALALTYLQKSEPHFKPPLTTV